MWEAKCGVKDAWDSRLGRTATDQGIPWRGVTSRPQIRLIYGQIVENQRNGHNFELLMEEIYLFATE